MGKKNVEKITRLIRAFKKGIGKKYGVEKVIIFGSAAKGKMKKNSDIDIIVVSHKFGKKQFFSITPKLYEEWHQKQKIDYPVDILLYNTREFADASEKIGIVSQALSEGLTV